MLQMIFQNNDNFMNDEYFHQDYHDNYYDNYHNHYLYHNDKQKRKVIKKMNDDVDVNVGVNIKNDTDEDWGFYVEIDPPTPPKHIFPKKNKTHTHHQNLAIAIPTSHYNHVQTQQKNVNYLHKIQEEDDEDQFILDMELPPHHSNDKTYDYKEKEKISQKIFSGLTICALTTASIYFYNKIRSY